MLRIFHKLTFSLKYPFSVQLHYQCADERRNHCCSWESLPAPTSWQQR